MKAALAPYLHIPPPLWELTLKDVSDLNEIIASSITRNTGNTSNMPIPHSASLLKEQVMEEWISDHIDNYINFVCDAVDFLAEVEQFKQSGYHHGPLGNLMPMAITIVLHITRPGCHDSMNVDWK